MFLRNIFNQSTITLVQGSSPSALCPPEFSSLGSLSDSDTFKAVLRPRPSTFNLLVSWVYYRGADKSLARPVRKEAAATKL